MKFSFFKRKPPKEERSNCNVGFYDALIYGSNLSKQSAMSLSTVFAATNLISDSIAALPIVVKDKNQKVIENSHINKLFDNGNKQQLNKYNFMKLLCQSVILKGDGFAYIDRDNQGRPVELIFVESNNVIVNYVKERTEEPLYYQIPFLSKTTKIEPINILHLRRFCYDGVNGLSVIQNATRTLNTSNATENSANNYFKNGCNLQGLLKVQGQLSQKQKDDLRSSWRQSYGGDEQGIAVIQGNMDYIQLSANSRDSQMIEQRQFNSIDICRFFQINPILLGDNSHSSYGTFEAVMTQFVMTTLQGYIQMFENELTQKLILPSERGNKIELDESVLIKADKNATANYYSTLLNCGVLSINEVRQKLGFEAIKGGDKHLIPYTDIDQNQIDKTDTEKDKNK